MWVSSCCYWLLVRFSCNAVTWTWNMEWISLSEDGDILFFFRVNCQWKRREAEINDIFPLRKSQINSIGYDALGLMVYRQYCTYLPSYERLTKLLVNKVMQGSGCGFWFYYFVIMRKVYNLLMVRSCQYSWSSPCGGIHWFFLRVSFENNFCW